MGLASPSASGASSDFARAARARTEGLDFEDARRILASADAEDAAVSLERARLAIYELDCDGATAILARSEVRRVEGGEMLADVAHGCQRVTAALAVDRDEERAMRSGRSRCAGRTSTTVRSCLCSSTPSRVPATR
jgi:hypothetical protein